MQKKKGPKILLWDIETSLIISTTFSLFEERLPHTAILQDWFIICAAWKELGKKEVHSTQVTKNTDDYQVCKDLRDALIDVDVIVHHNGDKFDIKKLNARLIYHKLQPLPPIPTVDTLKEAKRVANFSSNRLDYLAKHLLGKGKLDHKQEWWLDIAKGDLTPVPQMLKYNKIDVVRLEGVYLRLRPYMKNHPVIASSNIACPKCTSTKLQKRGTALTAGGIMKQRCQCQSCGGWSTQPIK